MLFLTLLLELALTGLDLWIAQHFYNVELHRWPYRESFLAEVVMPLGGGYLAYVCAFALLICLLASFRLISRFYKYCRQMIFFLIASLSGPIVIVLLKNFTHIHSRGAMFSIAHEVPSMRCSAVWPANRECLCLTQLSRYAGLHFLSHDWLHAGFFFSVGIHFIFSGSNFHEC